MAIAQFKLIAELDKHKMYSIDRNFSSVIDFLDRKLRKTSVHLVETPCYFYLGHEAKLEVTVFSNPRIASVDVRMMKLKNYDRDPYFERSYDLKGLSITMFQKDIDDLISQIT